MCDILVPKRVLRPSDRGKFTTRYVFECIGPVLKKEIYLERFHLIDWPSSDEVHVLGKKLRILVEFAVAWRDRQTHKVALTC